MISVTIGDSVTTIGSKAFYYCDSMTNVVIGKSVTKIESNAFAYCKKLSKIVFNGTERQWYGVSKGSDWNKNVPATKVNCSDWTVTIN